VHNRYIVSSADTPEAIRAGLIAIGYGPRQAELLEKDITCKNYIRMILSSSQADKLREYGFQIAKDRTHGVRKSK
jgi:hypothetical protein